MISNGLANLTVTDLERAEAWYTRLFGRRPDRRPMDGLLEWQLGDDFGLQVFRDGPRAGHSMLGESDLDARVAELDDLGIDHGGPQPGGGQRIVQVVDPDGNRVVLTGV